MVNVKSLARRNLADNMRVGKTIKFYTILNWQLSLDTSKTSVLIAEKTVKKSENWNSTALIQTLYEGKECRTSQQLSNTFVFLLWEQLPFCKGQNWLDYHRVTKRFVMPHNSNMFSDWRRTRHVSWVKTHWLPRETTTWTLISHVIRSCSFKPRQICEPAGVKQTISLQFFF